MGPSSSKFHRLWFVDFFRSLALVGMIVYHLIFDLYFFGTGRLDPFSLPLIIFARLVALTFLFLVGFSFAISKIKYVLPRQLFLHTLKRSLSLFFWAAVISVITFFINPNLMVRFGILNLISVSLLLLVPVSLIRSKAILVSLIIVVATTGLILPTPSAPSFDFFPVFPWFGIVLLGYLIASFTRGQFPRALRKDRFSWLTWPARHSLAIYLLHQPVLISLLLFYQNLRPLN